MTVSAGYRQRLETIRERARAARRAGNKANETLDAARQANDTDAVVIAEGALQAAEIELETTEALERQLLSQLSGVDIGLQGGFLDDPHVVDTLSQLAHTSAPVGTMMLGHFMSAEQFAASLGRWGGGGRFSQTEYDLHVPPEAPSRAMAPLGVVRDLYAPTSVLDLIPSQVMTGASFVYLVEGGDLDGADIHEEGEIKPEGSLELTEDTVHAVTIAVWVKVRRQVLDDIPGLQATIDGRLRYMVMLKCQQQVLSGTGDPELSGILDRDGVQTIAGSGPASDAILAGMTAVRLDNAVPTGVVMHPSAFEAMLTEKTDSGAGGRLDSLGAFAGVPVDTAWGVRVIQTPAIDESQALVADWARAAVLFIREGLTVRISDSDSDDFSRNMLTVLVETRIGLAVPRPSAIAVVQLSAPPAPTP